MPSRTSSLALPFLLLTAIPAQQTELPVQDLIRSDQLDPGFEPDTVIRRLDWIRRGMDPGEEGQVVMGEGTLLRDLANQPLFDDEALLTVLHALTNFDQGRLAIENGRLIVRQTDAAAALAALTELRAQLPPRLTLEVRLERFRGGKPETLLHTRQAVRAGSTVTFNDLARRQILRDFDVQIAQSASIANPVVGDLTTGACLAVRTRLLPGKGEVLIEAFARIAADAEAPPIQTLEDGIGPIDRAAREVCECGIAMRVPRGAKRSVEWTAANGDRLRLTCSASWRDSRPVARTGALVRCRGLFQKGVAEFRTDLLEPDEAPAAFATEAAFGRAGAESVQIIRSENGAIGAVIIPGKKAEQIDANVVARLVRSLGSAELEISVFDVPTGLDPATIGDQAITLATISSHVLVGRSVAFSGRTEMRYVHDWDVEVAQSARMPDPKVRLLRHGYHVDARVSAGIGGGFERVAIDARFARLDRIDVRKANLAPALRAGGTPDKTGALSPSIVLPKQVVNIESPVMRIHSVSTSLRLDANGSATMRCAAPRLLGKGRELLLVVRVKR